MYYFCRNKFIASLKKKKERKKWIKTIYFIKFGWIG